MMYFVNGIKHFAVIFTIMLVVAIGSAAGLSGPAAAQDGDGKTVSADADALKALEPFLEKARDSGATVIVVDPTAKAEPDVAMIDQGMRLADVLLQARDEFRRILAGSAAFMGNVGEALAAVDPGGAVGWILHGIIVGAIGVVAGIFIARAVQKWGRRNFAHLYVPDPELRVDKLSYLLIRAVLMMVGVVIFVLAALVITVALDFGRIPVRVTAVTIIFTVALVWGIRVIFLNVLAPDTPGHRMIFMSDEDAWSLHRSVVGVSAISAAILGFCTWMDRLGLDRNTHKLALIGGAAIAVILLIGLIIIYRKVVAKAILGNRVFNTIPVWRRVLGMSWHILAIVYVLFAFFVSAVRTILDLPGAGGLIIGPVTVLVGGFAAYALALVVIDKLFKHRDTIRDRLIMQKIDEARRATEEEAGAAMEEEPVRTVGGDDADDDGDDEGAASPVAVPQAMATAGAPVFRGLIEHGVTIVITFGAVISLLHMWGISMDAEDHPITRFMDVLIIAFLAYMAYQAVKLWVDAKIAEEEPEEVEGAGVGEDALGAGGASRLATLLPLFRNFLLITIVAIAVMIILSQMGVDIAPIFAGAGVVGLAIGFGAQTLVRDIFSGAFFLMDDAFRKGEYIDIGTAKGTVEKISIRSFQLRHHNGPLNTIPFGEITQLTNFSRDWVIMKLPLRVTYDTDVEKVRKLVKKLGQRLAADPEFGSMFLEPLKSQGVLMMDDSAMIIRVKFMCKPGNQFLLRRHVFTAIHDLFEAEGIKFAHREVTVRIADENGQMTEEQKRQAAAGAVRPMLDPPPGTAAGPSAADQM